MGKGKQFGEKDGTRFTDHSYTDLVVVQVYMLMKKRKIPIFVHSRARR